MFIPFSAPEVRSKLNELNREIDDAAELDSAFSGRKLTIGENQNLQAQVQK